MTKLRLVPYREMSKVLEAIGFKWVSQESSHNKFHHPDGRTVVIPDHGSQNIVRPLLRKILRQVDLEPEEYERILDEI